MAHTCRGTINLSTAHFDTEDSCGITLTSGARTYHFKASSEVERQQWITALELAKARAAHVMSSLSGSEHWRSGCARSEVGLESVGTESILGMVVAQSTPDQPWKAEVCVHPPHLAPCILSSETLTLLGCLAVLRMEMFVVGEAGAPFFGGVRFLDLRGPLRCCSGQLQERRSGVGVQDLHLRLRPDFLPGPLWSLKTIWPDLLPWPRWVASSDSLSKTFLFYFTTLFLT